MAIDRRFLNWGIFFVALGGVPLLVQQGVVSHAMAAEAWKLWPLIIVGIGIGILLRRTPAAFAGGLMVAVTFGLVFGGLLASGPDLRGISGCGDPNGNAATVTSQGTGTFPGTGTARIEMDCGVLDIATQPGNTWTFQGLDPQGGTPILTQGRASFDLAAPARSEAFWNAGGTYNRRWRVILPSDPSIDLTVGVNAGSGQLVLANAHLSRLDGRFNAADVHVNLLTAALSDLRVSVNAGAAHLVLPATSSVSGTLRVNAGSLDLCVPPSSGIRLRVSGTFASTDFASAGLVRAGDTWTSPNFSSAPNRIDLQLDANLASIDLNPTGGCQ